MIETYCMSQRFELGARIFVCLLTIPNRSSSSTTGRDSFSKVSKRFSTVSTLSSSRPEVSPLSKSRFFNSSFGQWRNSVKETCSKKRKYDVKRSKAGFDPRTHSTELQNGRSNHSRRDVQGSGWPFHAQYMVSGWCESPPALQLESSTAHAPCSNLAYFI